MEQVEEGEVAFEVAFAGGLKAAVRRLAEPVRIRHPAQLRRRSRPRTGTAIIVSPGLPPGTEVALVDLVVGGSV